MNSEKRADLRLVEQPSPSPAGGELDVPHPADLTAREHDSELRPVFPAWLADRRTATATVLHRARRGGRITAWHLVRSPLYLWRLIPWALRGAWVWLRLLVEYVNAEEYRDVVHDARAAGDSDKVKAERKERRTQRKVRLRLVAIVALAVAFVLRLAAATWGAVTLYVAGAVVAVALVLTGRLSIEQRDEAAPIVDQPQVPVQEDLAPEHLTAAFRAAGLLKESAALTLGFEGIWRDGDGWACTVDMPRGGGKTAADAISKRDVLAAELGVDEIQLIMDRVRAHAGGHGRRLSIWLADDDPYIGPPNPSPLIGMERFDLWSGPAPFGQDARGRRVEVDLKWQSMFFGGLPRRGKTFSQRLLSAAGVLDPFVDHYVADFKGGQDWVPIRQVAVRLVLGAEDDALLAFEAMLDEVIATMGRRFALLRDLPPSVCPEGKLTPQIQKRYGLNWIFLTIDELQEALTALDKEDRERIIDKLCRIARRGPAAGIISNDASQRPDADSVPTKLRDIISLRYCTQVVDQTSSDMVLGKGRARQGADASILQEEHKGVGVLSLGPSNYVIAKADYLDGPAFAEICARGRRLREQAGTLRGEAVGDVLALAEARGQSIPQVLNDCLTVMRHSDRMHTHVILTALENLDPDAYGDWDADRLAAELAAAGVDRSGRQVKVDGENRSGYRRADLEAAVPATLWQELP